MNEPMSPFDIHETSQSTVWVEVSQDPTPEVIVETEPLPYHHQPNPGRVLWTPTPSDDSSLGFDDSIHFQKRTGTMQTVTQLIDQNTRTSFEHVQQIVNHRAPEAQAEQQSSRARKPQNVVKKVIVIQPWDDPERATTEAINVITENLNKEAAQRLAEGRTPDKETVIEITRINPPVREGYTSPVNESPYFMPHDYSCKQGASASVILTQEQCVSPDERKHRRRKSPHPKRYMYHTPSPPQAKSRIAAHKSAAHNLSSHCYFESGPRSSSRTTASSKLLGLSSTTHGPAQNHTIHTSQPSQAAVLKQLQPATVVNNKPAILRTFRQNSQEKIATITPPAHSKYNIMHPVQPALIGIVDRSRSSDTSSTQEEDLDQTDGGSKLNESLTNIQWLGAMSGDNLETVKSQKESYSACSDTSFKESHRKKRPPYSYMHLIQMAICSREDKRMTLKEIYKWVETKFPYYRTCPNQGWKNSIRHNLSLYNIFVREKISSGQGKSSASYWTINANVTLKHTKSFSTDEGQNSSQGDSSDSSCLSRSTSSLPSLYYGEDLTPQPEPSVVNTSVIVPGNKAKKGPVPLLPKPPPMQTYALIPIQGGVPVIPQQPIMVSSVSQDVGAQVTKTSRRKTAPGDMSRFKARPSSATDFLQDSSKIKVKRPGSAFELLRSASVPGSATVPGSASELLKRIKKPSSSALEMLANTDVKREGMITPPPNLPGDKAWKPVLKRSHSPTETSRKHVRIATGDEHTQPVLHLWNRKRNATSTVTSTESADTSDLQHQLSQIKFADSGFISDCSSPAETEISTLPKPHLFNPETDRAVANTPSDCDSTEKKSVMMSCHSEAGLHEILSSIEKSLSSPMRNLLRTPPKSTDKNMFTSTPFKVAFGSPTWLSPIKGFTPIAGDPSLEGNLFTPVKEGTACTSTPTNKQEPTSGAKIPYDKTPAKTSAKHSSVTHTYPSLTPLKTPFKSPLSKDLKCSPGDGFSFSKFMGELHFESMIDEGINMDVSNMSFSALQ